MPVNNPRRKFRVQRSQARRRCIPFLLTFEQWWEIWRQSGHWPDRGVRLGQWVMARFNDQGAYEVNNVEIILAQKNIINGLKGKPKSVEHRAKLAMASRGNSNHRSIERSDDGRFISRAVLEQE